MRIDSGTIGMESVRTYTTVSTKRMQAGTAIYTGDRLSGGMGGLFGNLLNMDNNAAEAEEGQENAANLEDITAHFRNLSNTGRVTENRSEKDAIKTIKQQCIEFLMEMLFRFRGERQSNTYDLSTELPVNMMSPMYRVSTLTSQSYYMEEESTTFSTTGTVKTADGRELSFHLELGMSRRFEEYYEENYVTVVRDYCDPLVINLDTNIAQVSDQKFFFDLDADGTEDSISMPERGSGFLAVGGFCRPR